MKNRILRFAVLGLIGFALGAVIAWFQTDREITSAQADAATSQQQSTPANVTTSTPIGGSFNLVSEDGVEVDEQNWPETYKLVFFGFTYCPDVCPAALEKISIVLEDLGENADLITPLFITVDPARDTPEVVKEYTDLYDPRIIGLTGDQDQIDQAVESFKVYAAKEAPDAETEAQTEEPTSAMEGGHGEGHADHGDDGADHESHDDHMAGDDDNAMTQERHDYLMAHSAYIYLMSPDNQLIKIMRSSDSIEEIHSVIEAELEE
ncbi:MAG: SCO family protein [Pseudomonadota bacterium]